MFVFSLNKRKECGFQFLSSNPGSASFFKKVEPLELQNLWTEHQEA